MNLASWFLLLEEVPLLQCTLARCYPSAPRGFGRTALGILGGVYHEGVIGSVPCITVSLWGPVGGIGFRLPYTEQWAFLSNRFVYVL